MEPLSVGVPPMCASAIFNLLLSYEGIMSIISGGFSKAFQEAFQKIDWSSQVSMLQALHEQTKKTGTISETPSQMENGTNLIGP
jgi:hypothetical protein